MRRRRGRERSRRWRVVLALLAAGAVLLASACEPGRAAPVTVTLNVVVPGACFITVAAPVGGASFTPTASGGIASLNDSTTSGLLVSNLFTLNETCDKKYSIVIAAQNGGTLKGTSGNTDVLSYQIDYDPSGTNSVFTPSAAGVTAASKLPKTGAGGVSKQVAIRINAAFVSPDTYSDVLTITQTVP